ncbi:MAG: hypothetical protein M3Y72_22445 [Acidobacteriota bacterium]|nr:hypothetical protein [Acidobacteriota bacterium]
MARQPKNPREYRFEIDAFSPETIPLVRLSQYLGDLARIMGEHANVHLARIEKGSTVPVIRVDWEAEPKVRERLRAVKFNEGPAESRRAFKEINKRLVEDNANGVLIDPGHTKVLRFPGRDAANQVEFGPVLQTTVFEGIPIRIGGEADPVPVHLEDGDVRHIIYAPRRLAKGIAEHLFTAVIRVEGKSRWIRNRLGDWEMQSFYAQDFNVLREGNLRSNVAALREIDAEWKTLDDPLREMNFIRTGEVTA